MLGHGLWMPLSHYAQCVQLHLQTSMIKFSSLGLTAVGGALSICTQKLGLEQPPGEYLWKRMDQRFQSLSLT